MFGVRTTKGAIIYEEKMKKYRHHNRSLNMKGKGLKGEEPTGAEMILERHFERAEGGGGGGMEN